MKKSLVFLTIYLLAEIVLLIIIRQFLPVSIINWVSELNFHFLFYWILHAGVISFLYLRFFFRENKINYVHLIVLVVLFLIIRIVLDLCIIAYIDDKNYSHIFATAKVCFFMEIFLQIMLIGLIMASEKLRGYRLAFSKEKSLGVILLLIGIAICVGIDLHMVSEMERYDVFWGSDTVSRNNILAAFLINLVVEQIVTWLVHLMVLLSVRPTTK